MIRAVTANGLRLHPIYSEVAFCVLVGIPYFISLLFLELCLALTG